MLRKISFITLIFILAAPFAIADESAVSAAAATITDAECKTYVFKLAGDEMQGRLPGTEGYRMAADYVLAELKGMGIKPMLKDADGQPTYAQPFVINRKGEEISTFNLVGLIPGTDSELKDEYVTIGAHLDHLGVINGEIYNGADDNVSSCAALLEAMEALVQAPTRRSVIVLVYSAEEMGLLGSRHFVANPPVPLEQMVVNINMEMIGRQDAQLPDGFAFIGAAALSPDLPGIITAVNEKHLNYPLLFMPQDQDPMNFFRRSDHYAFHEKGIPAVFFGGSMHADYHQPTDDPELIVIEKVRKAALMCFYLTREFGNRDTRPGVPEKNEANQQP